jgi:hypothetical protein
MKRIDTALEIKRHTPDVFDYLTDLRNAKEWSTEVVDVRYEGELRAGATGVDTRRMGRKVIEMPWTITAFERPRRMVIEYAKPFPATAEFSFSPTSSGTLVRCLTELRPRGLWRLLTPVIAREAGSADKVQFAKVKEILESKPEGREKLT